MKNILRTSTVLMLVLGLGISVPKIMDSRAIDSPTSPGNLPVELNVDVAVSSDLSQDKSEAPITEENDIPDKNHDISEKNEESEENFPIKTDTLQNTVKVEAKVEPLITKEEKNNNDSYVANSKKTEKAPTPAKKDPPVKVDPTPTKEDPAPVVEEKPIVEEKAPETAPKKETVTEVNASYDRYAKTTLNVRTGPGTSYQKISTLKTGQKVLVTKVASNGWSYIESNGIKGYVSSSYLLKSAPPAPTPAPATKPSPPATPAPSPTKPAPAKPSTPSYSAYRMIVGGKTIPYKNGGISKGQSIIDNDTSMLSTWGGAETFSGSDGYNTHFIGHNPGVFSVLLRVSMGSTIVVTDGNATPTTYTVTNIFTVDDNAYNKKDGENYYNYMVSKRGGEVITLQTCLSSDENLIIRAEKK